MSKSKSKSKSQPKPQPKVPSHYRPTTNTQKWQCNGPAAWGPTFLAAARTVGSDAPAVGMRLILERAVSVASGDEPPKPKRGSATAGKPPSHPARKLAALKTDEVTT